MKQRNNKQICERNKLCEESCVVASGVDRFPLSHGVVIHGRGVKILIKRIPAAGFFMSPSLLFTSNDSIFALLPPYLLSLSPQIGPYHDLSSDIFLNSFILSGI